MSLRLVATAAVLSASLARAGDFRAAYVDLQRAVVEVDEGKAARARLQVRIDEKEKAFQVEGEALKKDRAEFEKQAPAMAEDARRQKGEALQKRMSEFAQHLEAGRAELQGLERKEMAAISSRMEPLLAVLAQREGFTMVFDKTASGLAYAPVALDLTNELIRAFNQANPEGARKAAPRDEPKKTPGK